MIKRYKLFNTEEQLRATIPRGGKKMVRIGEKRVCIFHLDSGFKVFDNLCPHNGHSLLEGNVNYLGEVVCALHGYRFDLNHGRESESKCADLQLHKIEITDEGVFLGLIS